MAQGAGIRIFADLTLIAVSGGFYVVPLYAMIQRRSEEAARARIIAAGNIMNALYMTAGAALSALMLAFTVELFAIVGFASLSDRIGRRPVYLFGALCGVATATIVA